MIFKDNTSINEVMGLAGINPVIGTNNGIFITNYLSKTSFTDPDLRNFDFSNLGICRTIDKDDKMIRLDKHGKLVVNKQKEILNDSRIKLYKICTENCEEILSNLIEEIKIPYKERPVHNLSFLYEVFTGNILYSQDQLDIEPLLEKIELEKISKILNGEAENIENQYLKIKGLKKESNYFPDSFTLSNKEQLRQYEETKDR